MWLDGLMNKPFLLGGAGVSGVRLKNDLEHIWSLLFFLSVAVLSSGTSELRMIRSLDRST